MISRLGTYSLSVFAPEENVLDYQKTMDFAGAQDKNGFNGYLMTEHQGQTVQIAISMIIIDGKSIEITTSDAQTTSYMLFNLKAKTGKYSNIDVETGKVLLSTSFSLLSYEYNNTHFMLQYTGLSEKAIFPRYEIEVTFNATN